MRSTILAGVAVGGVAVNLPLLLHLIATLATMGERRTYAEHLAYGWTLTGTALSGGLCAVAFILAMTVLVGRIPGVKS